MNALDPGAAANGRSGECADEGVDAASEGAPPEGVPVLSVEDVAVRLGDVPVLDGVSATVDRGRFVGLIGPNGAGKTTLLRTINGALAPSRGRVRVCGEVIADLGSRATSRLVATVPQDTTLTFDFDVRRTVAMGRTPHRGRFDRWREADERAVARAMERTGVTDLADRPITAVSGGERQRIVIARALAQETPLLLLDEPTASLDIAHQVRTLELVRDLTATGKTAVAAIHDLNLAAHYCDELLLLADGEVLAAGEPGAVLTEDRLREAFDANAVVARHPVTGSTYVTALPEREAGEGTVHVIGGGGTGSRPLYVLSAAGYAVTAGALNEGDTDTETARQLGVDAVTVGPYAPVDDAAAAAVRERVDAADVVVVADVEVGEGNLPNLAAARGADRLVLVEDRPFADRNFAGDAGRRLYTDVRERARVAGPGDVLAAVTAALDEPAGDGAAALDEPAGDGADADRSA